MRIWGAAEDALPCGSRVNITVEVTALLTLPLVIVGGGVTSKDAGMVYETAPLSDGALVTPALWHKRLPPPSD